MESLSTQIYAAVLVTRGSTYMGMAFSEICPPLWKLLGTEGTAPPLPAFTGGLLLLKWGFLLLRTWRYAALSQKSCWWNGWKGSSLVAILAAELSGSSLCSLPKTLRVCRFKYIKELGLFFFCHDIPGFLTAWCWTPMVSSEKNGTQWLVAQKPVCLCYWWTSAITTPYTDNFPFSSLLNLQVLFPCPWWDVWRICLFPTNYCNSLPQSLFSTRKTPPLVEEHKKEKKRNGRACLCTTKKQSFV